MRGGEGQKGGGKGKT